MPSSRQSRIFTEPSSENLRKDISFAARTFIHVQSDLYKIGPKYLSVDSDLSPSFGQVWMCIAIRKEEDRVSVRMTYFANELLVFIGC